MWTRFQGPGMLWTAGGQEEVPEESAEITTPMLFKIQQEREMPSWDRAHMVDILLGEEGEKGGGEGQDWHLETDAVGKKKEG